MLDTKLKKLLIEDDDFQTLFLENKYIPFVEQFVDSVISDNLLVFTSTNERGGSWVEIDGKVIDLDDLYDYFKGLILDESI
jgi:hypothetical protein